MAFMGWVEISLLFLLLVLFVKPVGSYIYNVLENPIPFSWLRKVEATLFSFCGIADEKQTWKAYAFSLFLFNILGILVLFLIQSTQYFLPLNPSAFSSPSWDLSLNTAVSFATNTNWQSYSGEQTMSYLTQMLGLTWQNFCAAGTGLAAFMAFARGLTHSASPDGHKELGNFWIDLMRSLLYIFIPGSIIFVFILISQGVIQNFLPPLEVVTLEGAKQILPMGPVASQEAIKILGTNGGGFFNVNSAHPFENPTPLTNFLQIFCLVLIPASLTYTYGKMAKNKWHGWSLLTVMVVMALLSVGLVYYFESQGNTLFTDLPIIQDLGNMEGKEVRFGAAGSSLFASLTTSVAGGAVNSMHDSYTPLGGMILLVNMLLGEVIFGSVGMGMLSMLIFVMITVFLAGLMIGRTPEYLGKKIEGKEIRFVILYIALHSSLILIGVSMALFYAGVLSSHTILNPHKLTQIIYAYTSAAQNNGSAFAGLETDTLWYNTSLSVVMFLGRYLSIIFALVIAGSMVNKKRITVSLGTLPTQGVLFVVLLIGVIFVVGALTFFPIVALGPFLEHSFYLQGKVFS